MHYNEPHNIPWWHGGDFGVVTSSVPLPPLCLPQTVLTWGDRAQITTECVVFMLYN